MNISNIVNSVTKTANQVGHQVGQYVDGHASGGLLSLFATGNIVCLAARWTGKVLQIVAARDGRLIVDGLGVEGPHAFNTHWTVINEGNNIIRLHNNNNYLCVNASQVLVMPSIAGVPPGAETKLRLSQSANSYVTLESVKEPGHFVAIGQTGVPSPGSADQASRQFSPRLLHSPYGVTYVQPHTYSV